MSTEQPTTDSAKQQSIQNPILPRAPWGSRAALGVSIVAYIVSQVLIAIPIIIATVIYGESALEDSFLGQPWMSLVLTGVGALGLLLTLTLYFRYKHLSLKSLGFKKIVPKSLVYIPLAYVVYLIGVGLLFVVFSSLVPEFNLEEVQEIGYDGAVGWQLALAFIGLVVIPPIAEEMLFRGFLYQGLRDHWHQRNVIYFGLLITTLVGLFIGAQAGLISATLLAASVFIARYNTKHGAAILVSALFGLVHLQWNVALDTFVLSFALIYVFEKTGNLWISIGLHALKNSIAFVGIFLLAS